MQGTIYKYLGSDVSFDFDRIRTQERYMYRVLTQTLGFETYTLDKALQYVINANNAKGTKKVNGKIQKGKSWVDPKESIRCLVRVTHGF